ncbi:MAG: AraC family transcriptional regulator [Corynebacteriales bacterium]|nr:AraC family transcriptional regulator [Mycobacteriales bacterium]
MDALADLLEGPRAHGAFLLRGLMKPPWSVRVRDEAPLTLVAMTQGTAWVHSEREKPQQLTAGDIALFRGPEPYVMSDELDTPWQVTINPGQICTTPTGERTSWDLGVRSWGNSADGTTVMLIGTYQMPAELTSRLLSALPTIAVLHGDAWDSPLPELLDREIVRDEPGQDVVLDRLLDLLLIAVLRAWFHRPGGQAPAWYRAASDPVVGEALKLLQDDPAKPWTVATLAAQVGVSRAALARRFTELVGDPPMSFLADLRLAWAAELLREPDATVTSVARKVGYSSPFALSTAFKRVRGVSPQEHRAGGR